MDAIQKNPLDPRAISIRNIDRFSISTIKKTDDIVMAVSDFGANALFSAVRRDGRAFGLSETRYLHECRNVFLANKYGKLVGGGIKAIHSVSDLALAPESAAFLQTLSNDRREFWKL